MLLAAHITSSWRLPDEADIPHRDEAGGDDWRPAT